MPVSISPVLQGITGEQCFHTHLLWTNYTSNMAVAASLALLMYRHTSQKNKVDISRINCLQTVDTGWIHGLVTFKFFVLQIGTFYMWSGRCYGVSVYC